MSPMSPLNEWDDFVILSLWAVFERVIIDFVREKAKILVTQHPREFSKKLHGFVDGQIEFWEIGDKLELPKGVVDVDLIGQARQIKSYRGWVVHKSGASPLLNGVLSRTKLQSGRRPGRFLAGVHGLFNLKFHIKNLPPMLRHYMPMPFLIG